MRLASVVARTLTRVRRRKIEKAHAEEALYRASQWQLVWWKFRKHKLARLAMVVLAIFYCVGIFCEFLSPYDPLRRYVDHIQAPPMAIRFYDKAGGFQRPFVSGTTRERDKITARLKYTPDPTKKYPIRVFVHGDPYKLWAVPL